MMRLQVSVPSGHGLALGSPRPGWHGMHMHMRIHAQAGLESYGGSSERVRVVFDARGNIIYVEYIRRENPRRAHDSHCAGFVYLFATAWRSAIDMQ